MKPRLLRNLLSLKLSSLSLNKIKLILNIGIFLSIFAITSSITSIYFESKITNLENKIYKNNNLNDVLSISTTMLPKKISNLEKIINNFNASNDVRVFFYLSKSGEIFDERELYYMPTMNLIGYLKGQLNIVDDIENVLNIYGTERKLNKPLNVNDLKNKIKIAKSDKTKYKNLTKIINKQHEGISVIPDSSFYEPYEVHLTQLEEISDNLIKFYIEIFKFYRDIHNNIENENNNLRKDISENSELSKNFIIFAFFLQLLIFIIIQSMEIITTRREINEK